jgi:hypothetical protein
MRPRATRIAGPATALGLALAAGLGSSTAMSSEAQADRRSAEIVPYKGWDRNLKLTNGDVELIVTLDVGPRILSYKTPGGPNVLKEFDDQLGKAGESTWQVRGGHRLWASPEDPDRTYVPDNGPVAHQELGAGAARFVLNPDPKHKLEKVVEVKLDATGTGVEVKHILTNRSGEPTEVAIWALTVMAPGGVEVIPLPAKAPHPGGPENGSLEKFAPAFPLVSWSYTDLADARYTLGTDAIVLRQDAAAKGPTKIGLALPTGVAGYLNGETLFIKRFPYKKGAAYPDFGSSYETFTNADMLEMESLGPLVRLGPNESVEHVERWELVEGAKAPKDDPAGLVRAVKPLLLKD